MKSNYRDAFPNFGDLDVKLPADFSDNSWKNDACPSFVSLIEGAVQRQVFIWIEHQDEDQRECGGPRFAVSAQSDNDDMATTVLASDDWAAILLAARVEIMKAEIVADMTFGLVPDDVADFASLHDHMDANAYGGFCDDDMFKDGWHEGSMTEAYTAFINACQTAVHEWLAAGGAKAVLAKDAAA